MSSDALRLESSHVLRGGCSHHASGMHGCGGSGLGHFWPEWSLQDRVRRAGAHVNLLLLQVLERLQRPQGMSEVSCLSPDLFMS
jgi:hypothetical protein